MTGRVHRRLETTGRALASRALRRLGPIHERAVSAAGERILGVLEPHDTPFALLLKAWMLCRQRQWDAAEQAARVAVAASPTSLWALRVMAGTLRARGKTGQEIETLREMLRARPGSTALRYRLGLALQAMNRFDESSVELASVSKRWPRRTQCWYRLGYSLERAGQVEQSLAAYRRAVAVSLDRNAKRFGCGVLHERAGFWPEAAAAHAARASEHPSDAGAHARLGNAWLRCHRWDDAATSLRRATELEPEHSLWWYRLGVALEQQEKWVEARDAYGAAAVRGDAQRAADSSYRAAFCLRQAHLYQQGCRLLAAFFGGPEQLTPRSSDAVLAEVARTGYSARTLWELGNLHARRGEHERAIACFEGATWRDEEHSPELWAALGRSWLALGREDRALDAWLQTRVLHRPHIASLQRYDWDAAFRRACHYTEYLETLLVDERLVLYESDHGRSISCTPVALFRELLDNPHFKTRGLVHVWASDDPSAAPLEYRTRENVLFVKRGGDAYLRALASAKYLVNSASFPCYFVRRPEQVYLDTCDEAPGTASESPAACWNVSRNLLHATHLLSPDVQAARARIERRRIADFGQLRLVACGPRSDAQACWRAARALLGEDESCCQSLEEQRETVLTYGGKFLTNGVTMSYLNLLMQLDRERFNVVCVVDPDAISVSKDRLALLGRVPQDAGLLARVGAMNLTCEEKRVLDYYAHRHQFASEAMRQCYLHAYRREARRLFGDARFGRIVNFDGYGHYWAALLGVAGEQGVERRVIYQHNDIVAEWRRRFPALECVVRLYDLYDAVVSVSDSLMEANRRQLTELFGLPGTHFVFSENLIDPEGFRRRANEPFEVAEDEALFRSPDKTFVTLGRLSPEKGHARLLEAFARVYPEEPAARLVVVGDGPCYAELSRRSCELGIARGVHLLGQRRNPYPYLKHAGCFLLASEYEGQPLVLLEALVLERPIICTRFAAAPAMLSGTGGYVVDNSVTGLIEGMQRFLGGELLARPFDAESYLCRARQQLYENVLGMPRQRS